MHCSLRVLSENNLKSWPVNIKQAVVNFKKRERNEYLMFRIIILWKLPKNWQSKLLKKKISTFKKLFYLYLEEIIYYKKRTGRHIISVSNILSIHLIHYRNLWTISIWSKTRYFSSHIKSLKKRKSKARILIFLTVTDWQKVNLKDKISRQ